jgi:hypothetical protein
MQGIGRNIELILILFHFYRLNSVNLSEMRAKRRKNWIVVFFLIKILLNYSLKKWIMGLEV